MIKQQPTSIPYASYCMTLDLVEAHLLTGQETAGLFGDIGAAIIPYVKQLAEEFKLGFSDIISALKNRDFFKLLKAVGFNLKTLAKAVLTAGKFINSSLKTVFQKIERSGFMKKIKSGAMKVDQLLNEFPILKKLVGPLLGGLLLFMWIKMSFMGDFDSDFDMSDIINAFTGHFSIHDLLTTANGLQSLAQFILGATTGLGFIWLASSELNLLVGIFYTLYKTKGVPKFAAKFFPKIKHQASITVATKLPKGIRPYAGEDGLESVQPKPGLKAWTTYPYTSKLEQVLILGIDFYFDGRPAWKYKWITGPDKGKEDSHYGRSYWNPIKVRK